MVIQNTFIQYEWQEEPRRQIRRCSSAPELHPPPAGLVMPSGKPPSSLGAEWRTTVLFRNVPNQLTRDMLVEILDSHGFRGKFDMVYLPVDFKTNQALGYGFVNAVDSETSVRLFRVFEGFQAWPVKSPKTCSVSWCERQGLESNVRVYRNLEVMRKATPEAWRPALFSNGSRVPFPTPTRRLRPAGGRKHSGASGVAPRF